MDERPSINRILLDQRLESYYPQMEKSLKELIAIPSVCGDTQPEAPFGRSVKKALDYTLDLAESLGFRTKNLDGFCGIADLPGRGEGQIGVLGHLDVVPAREEEWHFPPFAPQIDDGRIYGRGAVDDKGPLLAALYAAKALSDFGIPLTKTIRFIFGCNEESGMQCIAHYLSLYPQPECGFTPDASFPLVVGEKGICQYQLGRIWPDDSLGGLTLESVRAGMALNCVPACAEAVFSYNGAIPPLFPEDGIVISSSEGRLTITAFGSTAHASVPSEGKNAILRLASYLTGLQFYPGGAHRFLEELAELAADNGDGSGFGLKDADEMSALTHTCTMLNMNRTQATLNCDLRFPLQRTGKQIRERLEVMAEDHDFSLKLITMQEPLYLGAESDLAATLQAAYCDVTGDESEPLVIGGGTYAKSMNNFLAFGPEEAGMPTLAHQADEYITCEHLLKCAKIYARALYELAR